MPDIKVLDSHIADLIAAGEVVERPASVAKELMENAIDAGAAKVTVEIAHGGMTFLRVTDDGCGIPAPQLKTAFLRHATSKLRTEYDLEAIGTLGFRGEALAAIAAVSRIEIMSRTADAELGSSLSVEGGEFGPIEEAGCPLGTTIVVRDLFFNTPARLKFMKKDAAEGAAVFAVVQRVALSHPEVSVKFIRDGKQEMLTPGDGQLKSAVYAVLGRELALGFREVKSTGEDMTVTGFVSLPACCRGSRNYQFFFVNGRQVKSRLMMAALEEAYQNQKMVGKFPGCVLHLETKLNAVDVNVHPAKTEVKFGNERQVFSAVYHAVLSALEGDKSRPEMKMQSENRPPHKTVSVLDSVTPNQTKIQANITRLYEKQAAQPVQPTQSVPTRLGVSDVTRKPAPVQPAAAPVQPAAAPVSRPAPVAQPAPVAAPVVTAPVVEKKPVLAVTEEPKPVIPTPVEIPAPSVVRPEPVPTPIVEEPEVPAWRMAGEVLNTYIVVEQGDSVFFIDKHAAHERILYEQLKTQNGKYAQQLFEPMIVHLSPSECDVMDANKSLLEKYGFLFEINETDVVLTAIPDTLLQSASEVPQYIETLASKLIEGDTLSVEERTDRALFTVACKAALKAGVGNHIAHTEWVVRRVMTDEGIRYCPHGRPIMRRIEKRDIDKFFDR